MDDRHREPDEGHTGTDLQPQGVQDPHALHDHERSDVSLRGIFIFTGVLIVSAIVIHFALGAVMSVFSRREARLEARRPPIFAEEAGQFPPPRLQGNPPSDMALYATQQRELLTHYGWVDPKAKIARIPIDRAMDILAQKGLPARDSRPKSVEKKGPGSP